MDRLIYGVLILCCTAFFGSMTNDSLAASNDNTGSSLIPSVNMLLKSNGLLPVKLLKDQHEMDTSLDDLGKTVIDSVSFDKEIAIGVVENGAINGDISVSYTQQNGVISLKLVNTIGSYAPKYIQVNMLNISNKALSKPFLRITNDPNAPLVTVNVYFGSTPIPVKLSEWVSYGSLNGLIDNLDFKIEHIKTTDLEKVVAEGTLEDWVAGYAISPDNKIGILTSGLQASSIGNNSVSLEAIEVGIFDISQEAGSDISSAISSLIIDYLAKTKGEIVNPKTKVKVTMYLNISYPFMRVNHEGNELDFDRIIDVSVIPVRYKDNGDGTVTDTENGLMWQQENDSSVNYYHNSINYCENLSLANHTDWRLSSVVEAKELTVCSNGHPTPLAADESCEDDGFGPYQIPAVDEVFRLTPTYKDLSQTYYFSFYTTDTVDEILDDGQVMPDFWVNSVYFQGKSVRLGWAGENSGTLCVRD